MTTKWSTTIIQSCLVTVIAINLMLVAILISSKIVPISPALPSIAYPNQIDLRTEFIMELQSRKRQGNYQVEHYQEYEITKDQYGNILKKEASNESTYLRYWDRTGIEK